MNPPSPAGSRKTGHAAASDTHFAPSSCRRSRIVKPGCLKIPCWADDPRLSIAILKIVVIACYHAAMIWFIFNLGIRLATFVVLAAAFFRKPRARNRVWGSVVAIPCQFPAGPRGRGNVFPASRASDLAQAIDYTRSYRQNGVDFDAEIKILPDLREREPAPLARHAAASEMPSASRSGATRLVNTPTLRMLRTSPAWRSRRKNLRNAVSSPPAARWRRSCRISSMSERSNPMSWYAASGKIPRRVRFNAQTAKSSISRRSLAVASSQEIRGVLGLDLVSAFHRVPPWRK